MDMATAPRVFMDVHAVLALVVDAGAGRGIGGLAVGIRRRSRAAQLPSARLLVGALWMAYPLALAGAGVVNRRRHARPEAYFPIR